MFLLLLQILFCHKLSIVFIAHDLLKVVATATFDSADVIFNESDI
jgi:hypothetical protein